MPLFGRKLFATDGVMFTRDPATGELVPVTGTPTDGQVPTYDAGTGMAAWGDAGVPEDVVTVPSSPHGALPYLDLSGVAPAITWLAIPSDWDSVEYVLGIAAGRPAWRETTTTTLEPVGVFAPAFSSAFT